MFPPQSIKLLNRAVRYLESNLTQPAAVETAAAQAGYSRFHFSRTFLGATGVTPADYLRKRRLTEAARELATSTKRILEIALDYQFQSQEAFTRSFKREFGVSPGSYRQQGRLRRLFGAITLGAANRLLYPGRGIDAAASIFVPAQKIIAALSAPCSRSPASAQNHFHLAAYTMETINLRLAQRQDICDLCRLYHELHEFTVRGVPERLQSLGDWECFDAASLSLILEKLLDAVEVAIWVADYHPPFVDPHRRARRRD